jgi:hypothetical protein
MIKTVKKYLFADPNKKVGDIVNDQFDQQFKVIAVSDTDITIEHIDV